MKTRTILQWIAALIAAGILLQTLYFKFSGAPESVALFSKLGVEPWGRWITGITELVAGLLLLIPASRHWGALLGVGLMAGAILSHLTVIGIESAGDGGQLFVMAIITLICCSYLVITNRSRILSALSFVFTSKRLAK
jgi:uncharacterized membrane protein YphA (DoxX/SURF4 family)